MQYLFCSPFDVVLLAGFIVAVTGVFVAVWSDPPDRPQMLTQDEEREARARFSPEGSRAGSERIRRAHQEMMERKKG